MAVMRVLGQLLIFLILFQGCRLFSNCEESEPVSEKTKEWVPYHEGQEMYFESASGKDTLVVIGYSQGWQNSGGYKCTTDYEYITVSVASRQAFDDTVQLSVRQRTVTIRTKFNLNDGSGIWVSYGGGLISSSIVEVRGKGTYQAETTIDGKVYHDVVTASCTTCDDLEELSFNKEAGVIRYKVGDMLWTQR